MNSSPQSFETDEETLSFLSEYCSFGPNRTYILSAMARPKENDTITHNSIPMFREIITSEENLRRKYARLQTLAENYTPEEGGELTFRLYITANARDTEKAFYLYQKDLIEYSHKLSTGHEATREKIKRLDKEWESKLQTDGNKDDNYFIIDIDTEDTELLDEMIQSLDSETNIKTAIESPNGFHIITEPFNYPNFDPLTENDEIEIKTDGLMFIRLL
jgi:hypothetical protein